MTTAASTSASLYLWLTSGTCRWLLCSQSHHPAPTSSTIIYQSCGRPSFNLSSSSPSYFSPRFLSSSSSSNRSHNPRLFRRTGGRGGTHNNDGGDGDENNNGDNNGSNGSNGNRNPFNHDGDDGPPLGYPLSAFLFCRDEIIIVQDKKHEQRLFAALVFLLSLLTSSSHCRFLPQALAHASPPPFTTGSLPDGDGDGDVSIWQVKGSKWIKLVSDASSLSHDGLFPGGSGTSSFQPLTVWQRAARFFSQLMLPDGYPHSVTSDYLEYSLWRGVQGVASQINGVLATQVPLPFTIPTLTSLFTFSLLPFRFLFLHS